MPKPKCHLKFNPKISIFPSASFVYGQIFHLKGNENNLLLAIKVKYTWELQ